MRQERENVVAGTAGRLRLGFALALLLTSPLAFAETGPAVDRVSVWLGGYYASFDTTVAANLNSAEGSARTHLARDDHMLPRARVDFVVGERQGFSVEYTRLSRGRSVTFDEPFSYGGVDFDAGSSVHGDLDFDVGNAAYHWWFGDASSNVFGVGLGVAYYRLAVDLEGESSEESGPETRTVRATEDAFAPLLTLGWRHAFSDQLRLYAHASGIRKNGSFLSGHIYNASLGMEWFPWRNAGVALEYSATRVRIRQERKLYDAGVDMNLRGPSAFLRLRF